MNFEENLKNITEIYNQSVKSNDLGPIPFMLMLFCMDRLINRLKKKCIWDLYRPYLPKLFDYLLEHYTLLHKESLHIYLANELQKNEHMTFRTFLLHIQKYMIQIYEKEIKRYAQLLNQDDSNVENREKYDSYYDDYESISIENIFYFLIYDEYKENIAKTLSQLYNNRISENEIYELFEDAKSTINAAFFEEDLYQQLNITSSNCFLKNICKGIFSREAEIEELAQMANTYIENDSKKYINQDYFQENYAKALHLIETMENDILYEVKRQLRIDQSLDINKIYRPICVQMIAKYNLQSCENGLCDMFETSLFKLELEICQNRKNV